jgi:glycosyltransferase involved in cell wall biosynthesis
MPVPPTLTPIAAEPLSVVLLAREAAVHVEALLDDWRRCLDGRGQDWELLLVDDGSSDGTADRALAVAERMPRLRVLRHPTPQGEGAALRTGLAEAKGPLLFTSLCQPDHRPEHLAALLDRPATQKESGPQGKAIDEVHLISGYRADVPMPLGLRVLGWLWRMFCRVVLSYAPQRLPGWLGWRHHAGWLLTRLLFALRYHDVASPVRLMRKDIFARIPIQSDSSFAHVEVLAKANFLGHLMGEEVPLPLAPRRYRGDLGVLWRDGKRLFNEPDFGPAVLPAPAK